MTAVDPFVRVLIAGLNEQHIFFNELEEFMKILRTFVVAMKIQFDKLEKLASEVNESSVSNTRLRYRLL